MLVKDCAPFLRVGQWIRTNGNCEKAKSYPFEGKVTTINYDSFYVERKLYDDWRIDYDNPTATIEILKNPDGSVYAPTATQVKEELMAYEYPSLEEIRKHFIIKMEYDKIVTGCPDIKNKKEEKMKEVIAKNFPKTEDALVVEEIMGYLILDNFLYGLIIADHTTEILKEAKRLKKLKEER